MAHIQQPLPPLDVQQRYSIPETSAYLRESRAQIYTDIKAGRIRIIKHGARTYIPGSEIARLSQLDGESNNRIKHGPKIESSVTTLNTSPNPQQSKDKKKGGRR